MGVIGGKRFLKNKTFRDFEPFEFVCNMNVSKAGFNNTVFALGVRNDNRSVYGGQFTTFEGTTRNRIVGVNLEGQFDSTFGISTGFGNNVVFSLDIQSDNKVVVGGSFTTYQGTTRNRIVRLNSDGSFDTTFAIGAGFNNIVYSVNIQSDGKVIIGGQFTTYQGIARNRIVRLNSDGSFDTTFAIGTGFGNNIVFTTAIQSDDKVLVGGSFTTYQGNTRNRIIRLNSDASIDTEFTIGTGFDNIVREIKIQSDGKILVGGDFTSYDGVSCGGLVRLNSDGSIDNTFNIGVGFNGSVFTIHIQNDNKILVGGGFTELDSIIRNRIVRLNPDGSVDDNFNNGTGFNNIVRVIKTQSDGKILVGGQFGSYNGVSSTRVIRLYRDGRVDGSYDRFTLPLPQTEVYNGPNNTTNSFPLFVAAIEPRRGSPIEYDFVVDWGDGTKDVIKSFNQSERTHIYQNVGQYNIKIKGKFGTIRFNNGGNRNKFNKILNWGDIPWQNFNDAFFGCFNLNEVSSPKAPDLSNVLSIRNMFRDCTGLSSIDLNNWNTSKITDFSSMFWNCTNIVEINASNWDVTGTNNIGNMFVNCRNLEVLDVSNWDVSNAISAFQMFYDCRKLDPQVQNWNTSNIVFARAMFWQGVSRTANIDVSNWDVSSIRNNAGIGTSLNGTLIDFLRLITLPTALYDQILINWSEQDLKSGVTFNAGSSKYSSNAVDARNTILSKGWTISDGGLET